MRRNQNSNNKSKNADKGKDKDQTLDTSDLLIESRLMRGSAAWFTCRWILCGGF
jgi:hypothetical protein